MPQRVKPPFKGDGAWTSIPDWSDDLRETLRQFFPVAEREITEAEDPDHIWGDPAENFVDHVLASAWPGKSALHWLKWNSTKKELRAEKDSTLRSLQDALEKLRNLSPEFDRLLGFDADPAGCADALEALISHVEQAGVKVDQISVPRISQQQRSHLLEMTIEVLRALQLYGVPPAATADPVFGYESDAVRVLKAIGDELGCNLATTSWRDLVQDAKRRASDLIQ